MKDTFSILGGIIFLFGFIPYTLAILKPKQGQKRAEPSKATWLIWATLDVLTLIALYQKDALNGQIIGATIGATTIFILSLKYGISVWTKLDIFSLLGAVIGIVIWAITSNAVLALSCFVAVGVLGALPTFYNTWQDPSKENRTAWLFYFISCPLTLLGLKSWTFSVYISPVAFTAIETIMIFILFIRPRMLKK
jgi:hypothetical protein